MCGSSERETWCSASFNTARHSSMATPLSQDPVCVGEKDEIKGAIMHTQIRGSRYENVAENKTLIGAERELDTLNASSAS